MAKFFWKVYWQCLYWICVSSFS